MSAIFRSKLFESKSGYFSDSIGIGTKNPSAALHISSGNIILESGTAEFYSRPTVSGIPVMISGDVQFPDLSVYETVQNFNNLSGSLSSDLNSVTELIYQVNQAAADISGSLRDDLNSTNGLIYQTSGILIDASGSLQNDLNSTNAAIYQVSGNLIDVSGSLQDKIDNLNILANGASIKSDYFSGASYIGRALVGSLDSDSTWTVTRIQISNSGTLSNQPQKATSAQWSNRYFLNYT